MVGVIGAALATVVTVGALVALVPGQGLEAERLTPVSAGSSSAFTEPSPTPVSESSLSATAPEPATASTPASATPSPSPSSTRFSFNNLQAGGSSNGSNLSTLNVYRYGRIIVVETSGYRRPVIGECLTTQHDWSPAGVEYTAVPCTAGVLHVLSLTPFTDGVVTSNAEAEAQFASLEPLVWKSCFDLHADDADQGESSSWYDAASNLMHWDLITPTGAWMVEPANGQLVCMELV